jgi:hypothetical protein
MSLPFAFGGLCRLRKHASNRLRRAAESKYFCNPSVIFELTEVQARDTGDRH